ncbi:uncharacterized protein BJ171DRAFT_492355, partial [Polychytrium aggregatum]|uniref:uncharacterized protein n=1 Tax=Polychytrium aggregatum TaxID=110093 RepID=UPI0022FDD3FA
MPAEEDPVYLENNVAEPIPVRRTRSTRVQSPGRRPSGLYRSQSATPVPDDDDDASRSRDELQMRKSIADLEVEKSELLKEIEEQREQAKLAQTLAEEWRQKYRQLSTSQDVSSTDQLTKIGDLEEQIIGLKTKLVQKDKEVRKLNDAYNSLDASYTADKETWETKRKGLEKTIHELRAVNANTKEAQIALNHELEERAPKTLMLNNLRLHNEKLTRDLQKMQEALDHERALNSSESARTEAEEIERLRDAVNTLVMEKEQLEQECNYLSTQLLRSDNSLAGELAGADSERRSIEDRYGLPRLKSKSSSSHLHRRHHSAEDLLKSLPSELPQESLNLAMELRQKHREMAESSELEKLRAENLSLVKFLVATLDSVRML